MLQDQMRLKMFEEGFKVDHSRSIYKRFHLKGLDDFKQGVNDVMTANVRERTCGLGTGPRIRPKQGRPENRSELGGLGFRVSDLLKTFFRYKRKGGIGWNKTKNAVWMTGIGWNLVAGISRDKEE
ncbi:hypothetical protein QJS04_geneDACA009468 [Acorus gramineus]|uniref:Uncharacterized protein n=1 Tax=Acorus gramineus TaxID=55184 RepID=A0AAV9AFD4_ACOGR|nr:hypothetical protein QJS04_geneDACA009468 [Acorus gramineus]